jgi:FRG domain
MAIKKFNDPINSIVDLLRQLNLSESRNYPVLFRGQPQDQALIPSIARSNPKINTTDDEVKMLNELKRRSTFLINEQLNDDWEWLIYAQHFGMLTRLLDWTSNPLIALWFAIRDRRFFEVNSYLYVLATLTGDILTDEDRVRSPFLQTKTKILKPNLNNKRIIAQQGWFTSHIFSQKDNGFIGLETNENYGSKKVGCFTITASSKINMLNELNELGINAESIFPDITGLSEHINWLHNK